MNAAKVTFNTKGYDPFLDAIKAYAIIWVLIGHFLTNSNSILYPIFGGVQVPLFLTVTCFHFMKKDNPRLNLGRVFTRVLLPFVMIQLFIVFVLYTIDGFSGIKEKISYFLVNGGYGQGDYFPIVYVQIALLLPLFFKIISKIKNETLLLFCFIVLCELLEIFCSIVHIPDSIYRILAFRYVFLIYFGWKWAKHGITMNFGTLIVSLISLASIIYFGWFSFDNEPWFFETSWKYHRWPCYFFMMELGIFLLQKIWRIVYRYTMTKRVIYFLSKCSYEIFLAQMLAYVLFPLSLFSFLPNKGIYLGRFFVAAAFSLLFGAVLHWFFTLLFDNKDNNPIRA